MQEDYDGIGVDIDESAMSKEDFAIFAITFICISVFLFLLCRNVLHLF